MEQRPTVTEWAVISRQRFCNALAVDINAAHHCPLMRHITIKEKTTEAKGTHKYSTKSFLTRFLSRIFLPYWLKHRRWFSWCHISVLLFSSVHFARFSPMKTTLLTALSICHDEELNCWFFASSVWCRLWGTLIIQAIFSNDKRVPQSTRWKQKLGFS